MAFDRFTGQRYNNFFIVASKMMSTRPLAKVGQVVDLYTTRRKAGLDWTEIDRFIRHVKSLCDVRPMTVAVHDEGRRLAERYRLSTCDALICAAALDAGAQQLFSEDMQDGLTVDGSLRIVNPYLEDRAANELARN